MVTITRTQRNKSRVNNKPWSIDHCSIPRHDIGKHITVKALLSHNGLLISDNPEEGLLERGLIREGELIHKIK